MMANFSSALMPLVGSSSISSLGLRTVAIAMSSSLRMPWAARRAGDVAVLRDLVARQVSLHPGRPPVLPERRQEGRPFLLRNTKGHHQVVEDGFERKIWGTWKERQRPIRAMARTECPRMLRPMNSTVPPPGGR